MFRKPQDDDDDYGSRVVKAKPIAERHVRKLGAAFGQGKDFVMGSDKSQKELYGTNTTRGGDDNTLALTEDERNKIHAKILKAELKGDQDLIRKLKRKLEGAEDGPSKEKVIVMMARDKSGNIIPAISKRDDRDRFAQGSSRMNKEYGKQQNLDEMLREEKSSSAKDQLRLFEKSLVKSSKIKRHDDESVDDIAEMQKSRRKTEEKDERKKLERQKKEHRRLEKSLDGCSRCLESSQLAKQCVVAVGIHTYLSVVEWDGIDEQHCLIIPTAHCSSSIQLDENVWDEMRIWRKGLTAMWRSEGKDCVFLEMARSVNQNPHFVIECIPLPAEVGDTAPIYFKKAINECEGEYTDNKKLIDVKDIRRQIPRGFSYFAVDFGLSNGFAHVIEDHERFPATFAHEIIVGMLDLPANKWHKKQTQEFSSLKKKCEDMKISWEPYDWTQKINRD